MRYAIRTAAALALLAAACGGDTARPPSPPEDTPAPTTRPASREPPRLVGPVPEGLLLVREARPDEAPSPVYALSLSGTVQRLGEGHAAIASPDGLHVALLHGGTARGKPDADLPADVRVLAADGAAVFAARSAERPDIDGGGFPWALWSPDGSRLAYGLPDARVPTLTQVYVAQRGSWQARRVTVTAGYYSAVGWAHDGSLIISESQGKGGRLLLAGSPLRELSVPQEAFQFWSFSPSPDGRRVAFYSGSWEEWEVWTLDLESGASRLLARAGGSLRRSGPGLYVSALLPGRAPADARTPALLKGPPPLTWSPDGRRIAYAQTSTGAGRDPHAFQLRVADLATGADVRVTDDYRWQAAWSPDGRFLAASAGDELVLLGPDGSSGRVVPAPDAGFLWSGDGALLVFQGSGGISLIDPATGQAREATAAGAQLKGASVPCCQPPWSPSGRYLLLVTPPESGDPAVYVLDAGTAQVTRILEGYAHWEMSWMLAAAGDAPPGPS